MLRVRPSTKKASMTYTQWSRSRFCSWLFAIFCATPCSVSLPNGSKSKTVWRTLKSFTNVRFPHSLNLTNRNSVGWFSITPFHFLQDCLWFTNMWDFRWRMYGSIILCSPIPQISRCFTWSSVLFTSILSFFCSQRWPRFSSLMCRSTEKICGRCLS